MSLGQEPSLAEWPVAILAGGLATRLRPITETLPKALLEVADEPFVAHQLRLLEAAGFRKVVFCVGHLGEMIESFVGNGAEFGVQVSYVYDGARLRGTGGAIAHALPELGERFLILYGDSYLQIDYRAVVAHFASSGKPALMTVFRNEGHWDASNVLFAENQIRRYDKRHPSPEMEYIEYGLGGLKAEALAGFREQAKFDLADVYTQLVEEGRMASYEVGERFYEIGSPEGLKELDGLLRSRSPTVTL